MLKQVLAHIILISTKRLLDLAPKRRINEDGGNQSDFRGAHEPRKTSSGAEWMRANESRRFFRVNSCDRGALS